jgi:pyridoxine kinase
MHNKQQKIAVINDFCGFGRSSLAVSMPIISAMGIQCCPVPTSVFSNHTAFDSFYSVDFTDHIEKYVEQWKKLSLRFDGVLTGFLGSGAQTELVKSFFEHFKQEGTVITVDPVMGDYGRLYASYPYELSQKMKELVPFADILTPNLTEACILTDTDYREDMESEQIFDLCLALSDMGPEKVVISGIAEGEDICNYVFEKNKTKKIYRQHKSGSCREGTGDVFSAIIATDAVKGKPFYDSVVKASEFVAKCIEKTNELGIAETDGVCFEYFIKEL